MQTRESLNKALYQAARFCLDKRYWNDGEAVRTKRDTKCHVMYGRHYKSLTDSQVRNVINQLQIESGHTHPDEILPPRASVNQLKLLNFYAMRCALHYLNFEDLEVTNEYTGEVMTGWDLKFNAINLFEKRNGYLPPAVFRHITKNWVNPKKHEFMIAGNFKKYTKNPERFHDDYLEPEQCQYLITRFQQIFSNIADVYVPKNIEEIINGN